MNNEIELSNFAAVYNDFASAVTQLDSAFGNQILGPSTNALLRLVFILSHWRVGVDIGVDVGGANYKTNESYSTLVTTLAEKFLVVQESRDDIRIAFRNANTLVEFAIGDILDSIGHTDGQTVWCSAAQNGKQSTAGCGYTW